MHAIAHGGVRTHGTESALKVDSGRKISCHTGESNLRQRHGGPVLYQWATSPPPWSCVVISTMIQTFAGDLIFFFFSETFEKVKDVFIFQWIAVGCWWCVNTSSEDSVGLLDVSVHFLFLRLCLMLLLNTELQDSSFKAWSRMVRRMPTQNKMALWGQSVNNASWTFHKVWLMVYDNGSNNDSEKTCQFSAKSVWLLTALVIN